MRKPEHFWTDPRACALSDRARFILLWAWWAADADGRVVVTVDVVAYGVWGLGHPPRDKVQRALDEITLAGCWCEYDAGLTYPSVAQLRGWRRFTRSRRRPPAGDLPAPSAGALNRYAEAWGPLDEDLPTIVAPSGEAEATQRVFEHWLEAADRTDATKLTGERRSAVRARLREGVSVEMLCAAVSGVLADQWCQQRGFTDLAWICARGSRVERYASGEGVATEGEAERLREAQLEGQPSGRRGRRVRR